MLGCFLGTKNEPVDLEASRSVNLAVTSVKTDLPYLQRIVASYTNVSSKISISKPLLCFTLRLGTLCGFFRVALRVAQVKSRHVY